MLESRIKKDCIKYLKGIGAYVIPVVNGGRAGIPDIICCINGIFAAFEVKQPGKEKTLTELQKYNIKTIEQAGGFACMITSKNDIKQLTTNLTKKYR